MAYLYLCCCYSILFDFMYRLHMICACLFVCWFVCNVYARFASLGSLLLRCIAIVCPLALACMLFLFKLCIQCMHSAYSSARTNIQCMQVCVIVCIRASMCLYLCQNKVKLSRTQREIHHFYCTHWTHLKSLFLFPFSLLCFLVFCYFVFVSYDFVSLCHSIAHSVPFHFISTVYLFATSDLPVAITISNQY